MARLSGEVAVSSMTQVPATPAVGPLVIVAVPDADEVETNSVMSYAAAVERPVMVRTPPAADARMPVKELLMEAAKCSAMVSGVSAGKTDFETKVPFSVTEMLSPSAKPLLNVICAMGNEAPACFRSFHQNTPRYSFIGPA